MTTLSIARSRAESIARSRAKSIARSWAENGRDA